MRTMSLGIFDLILAMGSLPHAKKSNQKNYNVQKF